MNAADPSKPVCCRTCWQTATAHLTPHERLFNRPFIVCSDCGNKRCPKGTDHTLACTRSNTPGQKGSAYE